MILLFLVLVVWQFCSPVPILLFHLFFLRAYIVVPSNKTFGPCVRLAQLSGPDLLVYPQVFCTCQNEYYQLASVPTLTWIKLFCQSIVPVKSGIWKVTCLVKSVMLSNVTATELAHMGRNGKNIYDKENCDYASCDYQWLLLYIFSNDAHRIRLLMEQFCAHKLQMLRGRTYPCWQGVAAKTLVQLAQTTMAWWSTSSLRAQEQGTVSHPGYCPAYNKKSLLAMQPSITQTIPTLTTYSQTSM